MTPELRRINYDSLNARQKENFNFQKLSLVTDFGFVTMRLTDDWGGADFIAQHIDGETFLRVQLKGRLTFDVRYENKGLYIAFPYADDWYLFPHDELLTTVLSDTNTMTGTRSWDENGAYHFGHLSIQLFELLAPFRLTGAIFAGLICEFTTRITSIGHYFYHLACGYRQAPILSLLSHASCG